MGEFDNSTELVKEREPNFPGRCEYSGMAWLAVSSSSLRLPPPNPNKPEEVPTGGDVDRGEEEDTEALVVEVLIPLVPPNAREDEEEEERSRKTTPASFNISDVDRNSD